MPERSTALKLPEPAPRRRVLLAEDDFELRSLIDCHLSAAGLEVTAVHNGALLLERLADYLIGGCPAPDLVITDLRMPGLGGLDVFSGVRAYDWAMPWVLITAFGDAATHEEALGLGAAAVLDKPVDLDDLHATVVALLAGFRPPRAPYPRLR